MRKHLGPSVLGIAFLAACGGVDPLSALEKATYAEAAASTSDGLTLAPTDGAAPSDGTEPEPLVHDCSLVASEVRVRDRCDRNRDGQVGPDEEAALEEDFPSAGVPPGFPPMDGEGGMASGERPPPGDRPAPGDRPPPGDHRPRAPECQGTATIEELASRAPPPRHARRGHDWRHLLMIYDTNDSRTLEQEEQDALNADLTEGCSARNDRLLARFDANEDGALDEAETQAARETFQSERQARVTADLTAADSDGDGSLTCEEQQAFHEARHAEHEARRAQFDSNGDGTLDDAERAAMREEVRERIRAGLLPGEQVGA